MEPNTEDGLHSSPAGSSQGSDSGLAMMSPMETDFSSLVFSQLTSDLQQMLGVGATKGKCVWGGGGGGCVSVRVCVCV